MPYRLLARSLIVGVLVQAVAAIAEEPASASAFAQMNALRQSLAIALQRDDIETAAAAVEGLLECGVEPSNVAMTARSSISPRAAQALLWALASSRAAGGEEVALLLAAGLGDWGAVDSLAQRRPDRVWSEGTLQMVGAQAEEAGDPRAAAWAYGQLRRRGREWMEHATIPFAKALMEMGKGEQAAAILDSVLAVAAESRTGERARMLRARLLIQEGKDEAALSLLERVPRSRAERTEADLVASLIRFAHDGTESTASELETAARARPDLSEATAAYDLAQLARRLPDDPRVRDRVMEAIRSELMGRHEAAAKGYRTAREGLSTAVGVHLGIREARCWERAGKADIALQTWLALSAEGEDGPLVLLGRGDCLLAQGKSDSAQACYMAVLERFPASPHAARARSRLLQ